jgi:hypothetical protein
VVKAVAYGLLSLETALERYSLSKEEFSLWQNAIDLHGEKGLRVTAIQKNRHV